VLTNYPATVSIRESENHYACETAKKSFALSAALGIKAP
jgi:hypothetical protein